MEVNRTQVLKVTVHTEPKVMIEHDRFVVLNGILKSVSVRCIMFLNVLTVNEGSGKST